MGTSSFYRILQLHSPSLMGFIEARLEKITHLYIRLCFKLIGAVLVVQATTLTLYAHEVIQICGLSPVEIEAHQYDLSSVVTIKVPASQILPVYKRYMAELMPNLRQFNNVWWQIIEKYRVYNKYIILKILYFPKKVYAQTETMVLTALPSARSPSRADFLLFLEGITNNNWNYYFLWFIF